MVQFFFCLTESEASNPISAGITMSA